MQTLGFAIQNEENYILVLQFYITFTKYELELLSCGCMPLCAIEVDRAWSHVALTTTWSAVSAETVVVDTMLQI